MRPKNVPASGVSAAPSAFDFRGFSMRQLHNRLAFRPGRHLCGKLSVGALLTLVVLAGCRGKDPFSFVPVTGKITFADNSLIPAEQIKVRLVPLNPAQSGADVAFAATGEVDTKDGTFAGVTTHKLNDGVVPGKYRVMVIVLKNHVPSKEVPAKYLSATESPLLIEVTPEKHSFPDLHVEKP